MPMYDVVNYKRLLNYLYKNYEFSFFKPLSSCKKRPKVILRHDIDYSLDCALKMARIEHSFGVNTTYLVMVATAFYNIFEKENRAKLLEIRELGHMIGLHSYIEPSIKRKNKAIEEKIIEEFEILRKCIPGAVPIISWHNPFCVLKKTDLVDGRFINAYSKKFTQNFLYFSDSNCRYNSTQIIKLLGQRREADIQILIHPVIWMLQKNNIEEVLVAVFIENCKRTERAFTMNKVWKEFFPKGLSEGFYAELEAEFSDFLVKKGTS